MKVCLINNLYKPFAKGGAENAVENIIKKLTKKGDEAVLITLGVKNEVMREQGLTIYRLKPSNIYSYFNASKHNFVFKFIWHVVNLFNLFSAFAVYQILKAEKPDLVHTHNLMGIGFLTSWIIKKFKIPHVHTLHDVQLVEPSGIIMFNEKWKKIKKVFRKLYSLFTKKLFASPSLVISPSLFLKNFYKKYHFFNESKFIHQFNFLTLNKVKKLSNHDEKQDFVFLYVGQLEKAKGVDLLISAFNVINRVYLNTKLYLVGDGTLLRQINNNHKNNPSIFVFGRKKSEEIQNIYLQADVVILPSLCLENSPSVIFESFIFGLPVIASNIGGIPELVQNQKSGLLFEVGDSVDLTRKMKWCLKNKNEMSKMGRAGDEFAEKFIAGDSFNNLYIEYKALINLGNR